MQKHMRKAEFLKHITALDQIYTQEVQTGRAKALADKWDRLREHKQRVADRERGAELKELERKNRQMASALVCQPATLTHFPQQTRELQSKPAKSRRPHRSQATDAQSKQQRIEQENALLRDRIKNSSSDLMRQPMYRSLNALRPKPGAAATRKRRGQAGRVLALDAEAAMPRGYCYRVRHLKRPLFRDMDALRSPASPEQQAQQKLHLQQQLQRFAQKKQLSRAAWTRPALASPASRTLDRSLETGLAVLVPPTATDPEQKLLTLTTDGTDRDEGLLKLPQGSQKSLGSPRSLQNSSRYLSSRRKDTHVNPAQLSLEEQRRREFEHLSSVIFSEREAEQRQFEFRLQLKSKAPATHFYVGIVGLALEKNILKSDTFLVPWTAIKQNNLLEFIFTDDRGNSETVLFDITKRFGSLALKKLQGFELEAAIRVV